MDIEGLARAAQKKRYRESLSWEKHLWYGSKRRAQFSKIPFTIKPSDIIIPKYCPITGIELVRNKDSHKNNSASVDRVDNSLGYIPGNVRVISFKANACKSNLSLQEIKNLYEYCFG